MTFKGITAKSRLDEGDVAQLKELVAECDRTDGIRLKLNWGMIENRPADALSDFCYYIDEQLAGYVELDDFGNQFELTGAVRPEFRRQGIFRILFEAARDEVVRRNGAELLLVNYRDSVSGSAAASRLGVTYKFSEYCMEADAASIPALPAAALQLVDVTPENVEDLSRMLAQCFDNTRWSEPEALLEEMSRPGRRYFLARHENRFLGQIGVLTPEESVYIRAVGILPAWRRQGYGRQMLAATVQKMLAEGRRQFALDVATENSRALSIYQSCGFRETNVYEYYTAPLSSIPARADAQG